MNTYKTVAINHFKGKDDQEIKNRFCDKYVNLINYYNRTGTPSPFAPYHIRNIEGKPTP